MKFDSTIRGRRESLSWKCYSPGDFLSWLGSNHLLLLSESRRKKAILTRWWLQTTYGLFAVANNEAGPTTMGLFFLKAGPALCFWKRSWQVYPFVWWGCKGTNGSMMVASVYGCCCWPCRLHRGLLCHYCAGARLSLLPGFKGACVARHFAHFVPCYFVYRASCTYFKKCVKLGIKLLLMEVTV